MKKEGLTLFEGLVYLVIVAAVAVCCYAARGHFRRPTPHGRRCMSNLKQIGIALQMYSDDYAEQFPPDLRTLYNRYASDTELFVCRSSGVRKATGVTQTDYLVPTPANIPAANMSYCYVAELKTTDPADWILAFDEETNHGGDGMNVLYIAQSVRWQTDIDAIHAQLKKQEEELKAQGREMKIIRPSRTAQLKEPEKDYTWLVLGTGVMIALACGILVALIIRRRKRWQSQVIETPE